MAGLRTAAKGTHPDLFDWLDHLEKVYYPYQSTWKDLALKKRGIQKTETRLLATATGPPTPSTRKERS